jgi:hypothetical protein
MHLQDDHLKIRLQMVGGERINCQAEIDHPGPEFRGWVKSIRGGPLIIDVACSTP